MRGRCRGTSTRAPRMSTGHVVPDRTRAMRHERMVRRRPVALSSRLGVTVAGTELGLLLYGLAGGR
jgi:hypothetical protein